MADRRLTSSAECEPCRVVACKGYSPVDAVVIEEASAAEATEAADEAADNVATKH